MEPWAAQPDLPSCPCTTADHLKTSSVLRTQCRGAGQRESPGGHILPAQSSTQGQHSWVDTPVPQQESRSARRAAASDLAQAASRSKQAFAPAGPEPLYAGLQGSRNRHRPLTEQGERHLVVASSLVQGTWLLKEQS